MIIKKISIPVDFDLSFLKIRWSDHVLIYPDFSNEKSADRSASRTDALATHGRRPWEQVSLVRDKPIGEGVVYGGDWEKAETLARQMAEMGFEADSDGLQVCEQVFITNKISDIRYQISDIIKRKSNLKLKVGRNVIEDIRVIIFIRKVLKFPNEIRIDVNQGYSLNQLQYLIPTLKEAGIKYVEEPVKIKDLPVAAELLHHYGLKVILDESLNFINLIKVIKLIDVINIKLSRIGDINQALHLIKVAKKYKKQAVIGCSEELERGMAAIYALGHEAKRAGILFEVEGYGPLRLSASRRIAQDKLSIIPRWVNRLENLSLIFNHKLKQAMFGLWWEAARIPVLVLKQSKKLSSLSLRLVELTGKYPGRMHPKHLIMVDKQPEYLKWVKRDDEVLDIGCGNGQHSLRVAPEVKTVIGFDVDKTQLRLAKEAAVRTGLKNVKFENRSAMEKFPYGKEQFDCVLFLGVLEHLDGREKVLKEVWRVLKPGGRLLLGVPNEMTSWKKTQMRFGVSHYTDPDHKVEYTAELIRQFLKDNKFKINEIQPTAYDTPWAGFIDVIGGISLDWYRKLLEWKWDMVNRFPQETISYFIVANKVK